MPGVDLLKKFRSMDGYPPSPETESNAPRILTFLPQESSYGEGMNPGDPIACMVKGKFTGDGVAVESVEKVDVQEK